MKRSLKAASPLIFFLTESFPATSTRRFRLYIFRYPDRRGIFDRPHCFHILPEALVVITLPCQHHESTRSPRGLAPPPIGESQSHCTGTDIAQCVCSWLCDGFQLGGSPCCVGIVYRRGIGDSGHCPAILSGTVDASSAWYVLDYCKQPLLIFFLTNANITLDTLDRRLQKRKL